MPPRVFVTGFGPFGATTDNPSAILAEASGAPHRVLEVSWQATDAWLESGEADGYDVLLHLGFAARAHMTPELSARNRIGPTADVRGIRRKGLIDPAGPVVLSSNLWTPALIAELLPSGYVEVSHDAGGYLCNYIGYRALRRFPTKRVGFLHVPGFEVVPRDAQSEILAAVIERL